MKRPTSSADLLPSERAFSELMRSLWYGRIENIPIRNGQLTLNPAPVTVQMLKFGGGLPKPEKLPTAFILNDQLAEFFEQIRAIQQGVILVLRVQSGLPFAMELSHPAPFIVGADRA